MRFRPPCIPLLSSFLQQPVVLSDVLHHRWTTARIAIAILLNALALGVPIAFMVGIVDSLLSIEVTMLSSLASYGFIAFGHIGWQLAWMSSLSPVLSELLIGGTVYIIEDGNGVSFTTMIGVAEHPNTGGVVEAIIPGALFLSPAELRQFKPSYRLAQISWSEKAVTEAMHRQRSYRLNLE